MSQPDNAPSPELFFQAIGGFQQTAMIRTALELDLFAAFGGELCSAAQLAERIDATPRGVRILCDALVVAGFLTKERDAYAQTIVSATFLDTKSPAYLGGARDLLLSDKLRDGYAMLTEAVRTGRTALDGQGSVTPEDDMWVTFARSMAPTMAMPARLMAELVEVDPSRTVKVLDIAAGHGLFGLGFAEKNPNVEVTALDWKNVLQVARENAAARGLADRYATIVGDAFEVDFDGGYDLVLLTNFLHHFDPPTCESLLAKVHKALQEGGRVVTLEFVPNDDRISPPMPALFAMTMLVTTPAGDAYTFSKLEAMAAAAGFSRSEFHPLEPTYQSVVISYK